VNWEEDRARRAIAEIVADAEAAFDGTGWAAHELDAPVRDFEHVGLYLGSAGMVWALRRLGSTLDFPIDVSLVDGNASLLAGETGVLLVTRDDDARLQQLIDANAEDPAWEILWGSPGTMLAARHAGLDAERSAEILLARREPDGIWTEDLRGDVARFLGAVHGFAGNIHALRGHVADDELRAWVESVLRGHAVWEGKTVNWPPTAGGTPTRVQWCHGAPGIVAAIGDLMPEDLLLGGAECTWRYGPHEKGPGLCHGTAGNGYALLKTYAVTGDELWLERARSFAMAATGQLQQQRYALFTGDIGAALFLQSCLDGDARFPIMDVV
jgi:hypothetical protein